MSSILRSLAIKSPSFSLYTAPDSVSFRDVTSALTNGVDSSLFFSLLLTVFGDSEPHAVRSNVRANSIITFFILILYIVKFYKQIL